MKFVRYFFAFLVFCSSSAWAEVSSLLPEQNFGDLVFRIPSSYEKLAQVPEGTLAFRNTLSPSLSITIVEQYGEKIISSDSLSRLEKEVLDSYRLVGFTDAKMLSAELSPKSSPAQLHASLYFRTQSELFSRICLVSNSEKHYFFTILGERAVEPAILELANTLCSELKLRQSAQKAPIPVSGSQDTYIGWAFIGLLALAIFAVGLFRLRKRHSS